MGSQSSSFSGSGSSSSDHIAKQNVIEKIEQDMKEYKLATIQKINAKNILKECIPRSNSLVDHFLRQIEEYVFSMKNFDLMTEILTKESDYQFQFRNMLLLANRNIDQIFVKYELRDLKKVIDFALSQRGRLIKIKKIQIQPEKSSDSENEDKESQNKQAEFYDQLSISPARRETSSVAKSAL